jgi:hypothetical protein
VFVAYSRYIIDMSGVTKVSKTSKSKVISVTGHGDPQGFEKSRLPHFLDDRFTDGGEVVSLTCRSRFTLRNIPGIPCC